MKKTVMLLLIFLSSNYCFGMQASSKEIQREEVAGPLPQVLPIEPDEKDAKQAEDPFPHPWKGLIKELPKENPALGNKELDDALCVAVIDVLTGKASERPFEEIVNLVIEGADPVITLIDDAVNKAIKVAKPEDWKTIQYWMNCGLVKGRVKPFGSCGKEQCHLGEYVHVLSAPTGFTSHNKPLIIAMMPDLLAFCNDPRMHYMDGRPLTIPLSDYIFFETDPALVQNYQQLKATINQRFNRKIFLRDVYLSALFDTHMAGEDEAAFCLQHSIDREVLLLEETEDGSVIVQNHQVDRKNPWVNVKGIKLAQEDISVSKKYNEQLKALVQAIASLSKANDKYTKIRDVIARGGDPDFVQELINTIIKKSKNLDQFSLPAAIRGIEYAINMGLLRARRYPFGDCGKHDCYLPDYIVMIFASSGTRTPIDRDNAWNAIPDLFRACPDHTKHTINGRTVVTRIKEIIKTPARLKKNIGPAHGKLRKMFPDLSF